MSRNRMNAKQMGIDRMSMDRMRGSRWIGVSLLLLCTALFCNGCWDKKEFNQLALVQTLAIDYEEQTYQLTAELMIPKAAEEDMTGENIWIVDGKGKSVGDALAQISLRAPRELYLDHLDLVLLGEGVLQDDIDESLEYLIKKNLLRRRTSLLAVQGKAGEILQAQPKLADVDVFYLTNLIEDQNRQVKGTDVTVNDYFLMRGNGTPAAMVIPRVELKDEQTVELNGAALIQEKTLVRWVDQLWLSDYRWLVGGHEMDVVPGIGEEQQGITVEVQKSKCRWELVAENPLQVRAHLSGKVYVIEDQQAAKSFSLEHIEQLNSLVQQTMEKKIKQQVEQLLAEAQKEGTDFFYLGRWLYAWHPELVENRSWKELLADLNIEVQLDTDVDLYELK